MKTGNLQQKRHTFKLFLSNAIILDDTKSIIKDALLENDTVAAIHLLKSIKTIVSKIFWCRSRRITIHQHSFLNVIAACICTLTAEHDNQQSKKAVSNNLGISAQIFKEFNKQSSKKAQLILSGEYKDHKIIDVD
jgi:hypothetical protein